MKELSGIASVPKDDMGKVISILGIWKTINGEVNDDDIRKELEEFGVEVNEENMATVRQAVA